MRASRPGSELRTVRGNRLPLRRKNPYRPRPRMPLTPHRHQPLSVLSKCLCALDDGLFSRSRLDLAEPLKLRSENVDRPSEDWFSCHSDEAYCTGVAPSRFAGPAPKTPNAPRSNFECPISVYVSRDASSPSSGGSGGMAATLAAGPSASLAMENRHTGCAQNLSQTSDTACLVESSICGPTNGLPHRAAWTATSPLLNGSEQIHRLLHHPALPFFWPPQF